MTLPPLYDESDYEALRAEKDARIAALEHIIGRQEEELHQGELRVAELEAENGRWKDLYMKAVEGNHPTEHYYQMTAHLREKYRAELAAERIDGQHWVEAVSLRDKMLRLFMLSHVPRLDGEENDEWFDRLRVETEILRARAEEGGE